MIIFRNEAAWIMAEKQKKKSLNKKPFEEKSVKKQKPKKKKNLCKNFFFCLKFSNKQMNKKKIFFLK